MEKAAALPRVKGHKVDIWNLYASVVTSLWGKRFSFS